jgi:adenylate cyclase
MILRKKILNFLSLFLFMTFLVKGQVACSQPINDSLKMELKKASGTDRVDFLNRISKQYEYANPDSSIHYARQAEAEAIELNYLSGQALAITRKGNYYVRISNFKKAIIQYDLAIDLYRKDNNKLGLQETLNNKGNAYRVSGDYDQALANFLETLRISEEEGFKKGIAYASLNIGIIFASGRNYNDSLGLPYYLRALEICREIGDQKCVAYAINNIALVYSGLGQYNQALDYLHQSLELKQAAQDKIGSARSLGNIGDVYTNKGEYETSLLYRRQALEISREVNDPNGLVYSLLDLGKTLLLLEKFDDASLYLNEALSLCESTNSFELQSGTYLFMHEFYLAKQDYKQALEFYELHTIAKDSMYNENSSRQIAQMKTLYDTEQKEAAITQLTNEKIIQSLELNKSENLKWFFIIAFFLILLMATFIFYAFKQKQKANIFLEERNEFEIENKKRAIALFSQQVSKEVAMELLSDTFETGSKKIFACIMFLDIRGFTPFAENKEPSEIIQYQNDVFGFMIDIISKHNGIINQFLGDGFMATFGAPASSGNDCQNAVNASLEIVKLLNQKCKSGEVPKTKIGIGLHAGNIVTGNVGTTNRKQYSITGNTVILASRIEQLNKEFDSEVLISKEVLEMLDQQNLKIKNLGRVTVKGRGEPMEIVRLV